MKVVRWDHGYVRNAVERELGKEQSHSVRIAGKVEGVKTRHVFLKKFFSFTLIIGNGDFPGAEVDLDDFLDIRAEVVRLGGIGDIREDLGLLRQFLAEEAGEIPAV